MVHLRIRELRKNKNITQLKMAMDLNTTQNTISRYETGASSPGLDELVMIADYFGVSLDYLFGRTDNPQINR